MFSPLPRLIVIVPAPSLRLSTLSMNEINWYQAHHIYDNLKSRLDIESIVERGGGATRRMLLSDISQSSNQAIEYPKDMENVMLTEVVRCSKRIVMGATDFQLGQNIPTWEVKCHHDSTGPPLEALLIDANEGRDKFEQYADTTVGEVAVLCAKFPTLNMNDRVAVVVPNDEFMKRFQGLFESKLQDFFGQRKFKLVDAYTLESTEETSNSVEEAILFDTVENMDGLERLFVIGVALEGADPDSRTRIYRAMTRAHMLVHLVNERIPGGRLNYLDGITFEPTFNEEEEREAARRRGHIANIKTWRQDCRPLEAKGKTLLDGQPSWMHVCHYRIELQRFIKSAEVLELGGCDEVSSLTTLSSNMKDVFSKSLSDGVVAIEELVVDARSTIDKLNEAATTLGCFCGAAEYDEGFSANLEKAMKNLRNINDIIRVKQQVNNCLLRTEKVLAISSGSMNSEEGRAAITSGRKAIKEASDAGIDVSELEELVRRQSELEAAIKKEIRGVLDTGISKDTDIDSLSNVIEGVKLFLPNHIITSEEINHYEGILRQQRKLQFAQDQKQDALNAILQSSKALLSAGTQISLQSRSAITRGRNAIKRVKALGIEEEVSEFSLQLVSTEDALRADLRQIAQSANGDRDIDASWCAEELKAAIERAENIIEGAELFPGILTNEDIVRFRRVKQQATATLETMERKSTLNHQGIWDTSRNIARLSLRALWAKGGKAAAAAPATKKKELSAEEQKKQNEALFNAAEKGEMGKFKAAIAAGAEVDWHNPDWVSELSELE